MLIHDDIFSWSGWGGTLNLASGKCRLRIYDQKKKGTPSLMHLKSIVAVVSDIPNSKMSVKSCTSHVATKVAEEFNIDPQRMLWVEYYPESKYGVADEHTIPERLEAVEFTWFEGKAVKPKWRELEPPLLEEVQKLIS
jgi:hypothetical protein